MPDTLEAPPETTATLNPELAKLFKVKVPEPDPPPVVPGTKPDVTPPAVPPDKEAPPAAPPADKVDVNSRIAPDFTKKPDTAAPVVPDADLIELDAAIKSAPTEKARVDLAKFRDQLATLKKENATLKTRPAAAPEGESDFKSLFETTKKERDELLERVERTNLFESPKFQQSHLIPRQKQFERLQGLVKESGGDVAAIQRAIGMTGKSRIDALDEIRADIGSEMLKGQFDRLVEDIDARSAEINEKVRNAKQTAQELRQAELLTREEQHAQITKEFEGLLSHAVRDASENLMPELFVKVDDPQCAWWNEAIDRDAQVAREALLESTPQKAAYAAVFASKAGTLYEIWKAERAANNAKDDIIAELRGAGPSLKAERTLPKADAEPATTETILSRLQSGAYKKS